MKPVSYTQLDVYKRQGGCQAGGSIWKETISLEPKDKTVSEETLDPETDIDGQVESEPVSYTHLQ